MDQELSVNEGEEITFTSQVEECNPTYSYQWQKDGIDIPGAQNDTYTIASATGTHLGDYTIVVTACGQNYTSKKARAIPDDFVDGEYEIRIRMECDFSNTYSNTVVGSLARREIGLYGISLFTETSDMSVSHKLRSLSELTEGDIILTGDKFAQYNDSIEWYSFGDAALIELNTREGYMIYLQSGPDTLRVSGGLVAADDINLRHGWNWMGFPLY